jgi:hypothetical protein
VHVSLSWLRPVWAPVRVGSQRIAGRCRCLSARPLPAIGLLGRGTRAPLGSDERGPGRQKGVEDSDGAVRPPAGLCRRPRSATVMPLLMRPFKRRQAPRWRAGARAVRLRRAAEARRRRTSPDAAESGGGKRRGMPPRRWPRPGGNFARSLSADLWPNLSAAARASTNARPARQPGPPMTRRSPARADLGARGAKSIRALPAAK